MALKKFFEFLISESEDDPESLISGFEDLGINEKPKVWFFILDVYEHIYSNDIDNEIPDYSYLIVIEASSEKEAMDFLSEYSQSEFKEEILNRENWDQFIEEFNRTSSEELYPVEFKLYLKKEIFHPNSLKFQPGFELFSISMGHNKILNQELMQKYGVGTDDLRIG
jgi:hypothetical protein